jgi:uncharacterized alpha-E superfamily protein
MNYEPDDFDDVLDDPYHCPKTDALEAALEAADYLRDKMKDEAWERAVEASEARKRQAQPPP